MRKRAVGASKCCPKLLTYTRRVDRGAGGKSDDRNERVRITTAIAVDLDDGVVCLVRFPSRKGELLRQGVDRLPRRGEAGDGRDQPEEHDDQLVREDPAGQCGHGVFSPKGETRLGEPGSAPDGASGSRWLRGRIARTGTGDDSFDGPGSEEP